MRSATAVRVVPAPLRRAAWLFGGLLLFELYSLLFTLKISQQPHYLVRQMGADALLAASWAEDVARHAYGLAGFQLPRVPSLFPDLLLQAASSAAAPSLGWAVFLYAAVQFQALLLAAALVTARLSGRSFAASLGLVAAVLPAIVFVDIVLPAGANLTAQYFAACFHTGPYLLALLASLLVFALGRRWRGDAAAALALLIFLATLSDRLILLTFTAPAMAALAIGRPRAMLRRIRRHRALLALMTIATIAAIVADLFLNRQSNNSLRWRQMHHRLADFAIGLVDFARDHPWSMLVGIVVPVAAWLVYPRLVRGRPVALFAHFCWRLTLFGMVAMAAFTALLLFEDRESYRYFAPLLLWPILFLAALLGRIRHGGAIAGGIAGLVLLASAQGLATPAARIPGPVGWRSPAADCLLAAKARFGLKAGIAEYWTARPIMMASNWRLQIAQAELSGRPQIWGNNAFWYVLPHDGSAGPPQFNYIVMHALQPATIRARYGAPDRILDCPGDAPTIWIYRDAARLTAAFLADLRPPPGPYLASCTSAVLGEKRLFAACATEDGGRRYTSLARPDRRPGRIANRDGWLVRLR